MTPTCKYLSEQASHLFACAEVNGYIRIRTPLVYPDGDLIDVFARTEDEIVSLTDLGETLRWLRIQSISTKRSRRQKDAIERVRLSQGVDLFRGELMLRVRNQGELANSVTRLGQTCARVADVCFSHRARATTTAVESVAEFMRANSIDFEVSPPLVGGSGKERTVDFQTRTPSRTSLVKVLATSTRASTRAMIDHTVATWFDLKRLRPTTQFVTLFDDASDVWVPSDYQILGELSTLCYSSNLTDYKQKITV